MSLVRDAERLVTRINAARLGLSLPPIFLGHAARQLVAVKPGARTPDIGQKIMQGRNGA